MACNSTVPDRPTEIFQLLFSSVSCTEMDAEVVEASSSIRFSDKCQIDGLLAVLDRSFQRHKVEALIILLCKECSKDKNSCNASRIS